MYKQQPDKTTTDKQKHDEGRRYARTLQAFNARLTPGARAPCRAAKKRWQKIWHLACGTGEGHRKDFLRGSDRQEVGWTGMLAVAFGVVDRHGMTLLPSYPNHTSPLPSLLSLVLLLTVSGAGMNLGWLAICTARIAFCWHWAFAGVACVACHSPPTCFTSSYRSHAPSPQHPPLYPFSRQFHSLKHAFHLFSSHLSLPCPSLSPTHLPIPSTPCMPHVNMDLL